MSPRTRPVVAIDGPAGAGKSTVTRSVAEQLGYVRVDTGALYRTVALAADRAGISFEDSARVAKFATALVQRGAVQLERASDGTERVLLDREDISGSIRSQRIGDGASRVSALPEVRSALLDLQRAAGASGGVVLEGRDIGTVVFPDAEAKFFLTASVEVRATRRYEELTARGERPELAAVRAEVIERDTRDSSRAVAPLRQAEDALVVDSSNLDIEAVTERIVRHVREVERRLSSRAR